MPPRKNPGATPSAAPRAVTAFLDKMAKSYGVGTFQLAPPVTPYDVISTGSLILDTKLSVGGWVRGRLHEIWGPEGSGKSLLCLWGCREAQIAVPDLYAAYIDMEHRFDKAWAIAQGVNLDRLVLTQPNSAEEVADMVKDMCRSGLFSLIVVDSIGAMIPEGEMEKAADEETVGKQAKIVTRMVKIAAVEADRTKTTILLINQVRANIAKYGAATTTGGGFALKHASTTKIAVRRGDAFTIKDGDDTIPVGYHHHYRIERLSVAPAGRVADLVVFNVPTEKYGPIGLDAASEAFDVGVATGVIIKRGGGNYILPTGEQIRSEDNVIEAIRADRSLIGDIRTRALATLADQVVSGVEVETDDEPVEESA